MDPKDRVLMLYEIRQICCVYCERECGIMALWVNSHYTQRTNINTAVTYKPLAYLDVCCMLYAYNITLYTDCYELESLFIMEYTGNNGRNKEKKTITFKTVATITAIKSTTPEYLYT